MKRRTPKQEAAHRLWVMIIDKVNMGWDAEGDEEEYETTLHQKQALERREAQVMEQARKIAGPFLDRLERIKGTDN